MRGLLVGRNTLATGVAITAAAGLIAATPPPTHPEVAVSHRAVALTVAPSFLPRRLPTADLTLKDVVTVGTTITAVAAIVSGPVGAATAVVGALWSQRELVADPVTKLLKGFKNELKKTVGISAEVERLFDEAARKFDIEGDVVTLLLEAARLTSLTNLDSRLTTLQKRVEQRQKVTDEQLDEAQLKLSGALDTVAKTLGVKLPTDQVDRWFDQAELGVDNSYDNLEARLKKFQEQLDKLIESASAGAEPSARLAVSKTSGSRLSEPRVTKSPSAARSARQAAKPAPANSTGKAKKPTSTHARSARAAK